MFKRSTAGRERRRGGAGGGGGIRGRVTRFRAHAHNQSPLDSARDSERAQSPLGRRAQPALAHAPLPPHTRHPPPSTRTCTRMPARTAVCRHAVAQTNGTRSAVCPTSLPTASGRAAELVMGRVKKRCFQGLRRSGLKEVFSGTASVGSKRGVFRDRVGRVKKRCFQGPRRSGQSRCRSRLWITTPHAGRDT